MVAAAHRRVLGLSTYPSRMPGQAARCWPASSGLGGQAQISLEKYPRIVFAVALSLSRVVDLRRSPRLKVAASLRQFCLALDNLSVSMEVGYVLAKRRIQGVLFPSVVGTDANLVVYVQNCRRGALAILNADELREKVKEMARRLRGAT